MISCIVAKAANGVIGSRNAIPWYVPADLKHFKEITTGKTVVMGRKTFQSIIDRNGKPLPSRQNVVVTRDMTFSYPGVTVIHDINDITSLGDCFIIGGAELWRQTFDMLERLYVTEINAEIEGDVHFPVIDKMQWHEVSRESHKTDAKNPYDYDFVTYYKTSP